MMTWFPNASIFDSLEALELPQLAQTFDHSLALFDDLVFSEDYTSPMPLVVMWRGHERYLAAYAAAAAVVLVGRGVSTGVRAQELAQTVSRLAADGSIGELDEPSWLNDHDVLRSHRSNLMRRWPELYSWPNTPIDLPYIWPVSDAATNDHTIKISKYDLGLIAKGERSVPKKIMERVS